MRSILTKVLSVVLALTLVLSVFGVSEVRAAEKNDFLNEVKGEYVPLFEGTTFDAKYDHYWHDYSAAVAGESLADMCVAMLKSSIGASTYGEEAGEEFFCGFTNDVVKINFGGKNGTKVTFTLKDGKKITHNYSFVKEAEALGSMEGQDFGMTGYLYKSKDDNKDEFTYIFMCPDTPASTYHIEFRYGESEEEILKLTDGKYKNWLAAGFLASALEDPKEVMLSQVIGLFVVENLEAMSGEEAIAQRENISGLWDMDTTAFKDYPGYENARMYIDLSETGTGKSYVNMTGSGAYIQVSEYPYFVYAPEKENGTEKGVYLVMSDDEGLKTATYEISEKDGKRVLIFNSSEGVLNYYGREQVKAGTATITKAKIKNGKKLTLAWTEAENADGYEILISTGKKFKNARTVTVEGKTSAKIGKLKKKTYYVKIRAYAVDDSGSKVYGDYSATTKIRNK
ncbi:MAG: hypothetical protein J5712_08815 [Lachnospiraceae bacterium]|nr:hypothetical protein [Lachnospiraceae bacterium]